MDITLIDILLFCIGWFLGSRLMAFKIRLILTTTCKKHNITIPGITDDSSLQKVITTNTILHTETVNGVLFLYNKTTQAFLCQANTLEEIASLYKKYHTDKLAAVIHNNKNIWFKDGEVHIDELN